MNTRPISRVAAPLALALGLAFGIQALPADAAAISGAVTDVSLVEAGTTATGMNRFELDFTIPDSASAGDTFALKIDSRMVLSQGITFNVTSPDGEIVAKGVVGADGVITFTLTDYVDTHTGVTGKSWVETVWNTTVTGTESGHTVQAVFGEVNGRSFDVPVVVGPPSTPAGGASGSKWMGWADNGTHLVWAISSPILLDSMVGDTITLTDKGAVGADITCTVRGFKFMDGTNTRVETNVTAPDATASCDSTAKSVSFTVTADMVGSVAVLNGLSLPTSSTQTSFTNNGEVAINGVPKPVSATTRRMFAGGVAAGTASDPIPTPSTPAPSTPAPSLTPSTPAPTPTPSAPAPSMTPNAVVPSDEPTPALPRTPEDPSLPPSPALPQTPGRAALAATGAPEMPVSLALASIAIGSVLVAAGARRRH